MKIKTILNTVLYCLVMQASTLQNVFAEDKLGEPQNLKELLQNAPESVDDYFVVPKVVD